MFISDESVFQLRAHIFQARNLIGSDDSGLSDPFARVIIGTLQDALKYFSGIQFKRGDCGRTVKVFVSQWKGCEFQLHYNQTLE